MMRTQFDDLFFSRLPYMREVFFEEFGEPDDAFAPIFNMETSARMREQTTGVTGFGFAAAKDEGSVVTYDILMQAYDKTFTHLTYALAFAVTEEAFEDDLDGPMRQGARALARSMRTTKNVTVWNAFNNSFTTTEDSGDGKAPFDATHPLRGGGTFDNLVSGDFSIQTLETALNTFDDMTDQRGLLLEIQPAVLLHPPELRWIVHETLGSPERPDTADRAINVVQGILQPVMSKWLTGDDDWFVGTSPGDHAVMLFNRRPLSLASDTDFDTGNGKTKATERYSRGWADWLGWVGGQGT
jgi:hypothetical protein